MIGYSHEMPMFMLRNGDEARLNTYFYALVHLFDHPIYGSEYYNYTCDQLKKGREVILDNSVFELETPFDSAVFAKWVRKLHESVGRSIENLVYIVPDILDDGVQTLLNTKEFFYKNLILPGKAMSVIQGKTFNELLECYDEISKIEGVERIGISFNCLAYEDFASKAGSKSPQLKQWSDGRRLFLDLLCSTGRLNKPLHLLGASYPDEFKTYTTDKPEIGKYIASIDTSNPVVHGILGIEYQPEYGLRTKKSIKLADLFDKKQDECNVDIIYYNVDMFKKINSL